ncbi:DMT family transporter [Actinoplanes sp. CA-131856]
MIPSWSVALAVVLCLLSAVAYAFGARIQHQVADKPVRALLRTRRWWLAMAGNGAGAVLHVIALRYGPLTLVQALGVLTLVAAALIGRRRITRTELAGTALTTVALTIALTFVGSSSQALTAREAVAVTLAAVAIMAWAATRTHLPALASAAVGGVAFGVASAITQTTLLNLTGRPLGVAAIALLNAAAIWFTQRSYRAGLAAPLATGTVANPAAAALIGVLLLDQTFHGGTAGVFVLVVCAAAVTAGVWLLARAQDTTLEPRPEPAALAHT